jgi:hypothetical protein
MVSQRRGFSNFVYLVVRILVTIQAEAGKGMKGRPVKAS